MILLAVETAYDVCGVALVSRDRILGLEESIAPRRHIELLAPAVERLMATARVGWEDLAGIAVSAGPGSFTGLRIGMSYVKGLAWGTNQPVYAVPTLPSLMIDEEVDPPHWIAAWSHRERIFAQRREIGGRFGEITSMDWQTFAAQAAGDAVAGYGLERFLPAEGITFVPACPSAVKVGKFALTQDLQPTSDLDNLVPNYLHEFQPRRLTDARS